MPACRVRGEVKSLLISESNAAFVEAVGGELDFDAVSGEDFDVVHTHFACDVAQNHVAIVQLDAKRSVGEGFDHFAVDLDYVIFYHDVPFVLFNDTHKM
jgi:hypothetical protein